MLQNPWGLPLASQLSGNKIPADGGESSAKFAPGKPFSIAAGTSYNRKQGRGPDWKSYLALEPRPQEIRHRQPDWLLFVSHAPEDDKDPVPGPRITADKGAVPGDGVRIRDEHVARTGPRPNHNLAFTDLIGLSDVKMLLCEKGSDLLLHVLLARTAQIWANQQLRTKRERKRYDKEPLEHGRITHTAAWENNSRRAAMTLKPMRAARKMVLSTISPHLLWIVS